MNINTKYPLHWGEDEVQLRSSDYVCFECGRQFLTDAQLQSSHVCTFSSSECGLCRQVASTTHIRNYNYLRIPAVVKE